jgi:hypothetical protein
MHSAASDGLAGISSKSFVEAKNVKARAQARWRKLRLLIRNLEFPKITVSENRRSDLQRLAPVLECDAVARVDVSPDWLLKLQDFWFGTASAPLTSH